MKKRLAIGVFVAFIGLVCLVMLLPSLFPEPKYQNKGLSHWLADLNGSNYVKRAIAADAIAKIGEPALPILIQALEEKDTVSDKILRFVRPKMPKRIQAQLPIPNTGATARFNAAVALAEFGPAASNAAPALVIAMSDPSLAVRSRSEFALSRMGAAALPAMIKGLPRANAQARERLLNIIVTDGLIKANAAYSKQVASILIDWLKTRRGDPDRLISGLLKQVGEAAVPELITLKSDADPELRLQAALMLGRINKPIAENLPALAVGLNHPNTTVRTEAINQICRIQEPEALAVLHAAQTNKVPYVQTRATITLISRGSTIEEELPYVQASLNSGDSLSKGLMESAISRSTNNFEKLVGQFTNEFKSASPERQVQLLRLLSSFHEKAKPALPLLLEIIQNDNDSNYLAAINTLGSIGPAAKEAEPILQKVAQNTPIESLKNLCLDALDCIEGRMRKSPNPFTSMGSFNSAWTNAVVLPRAR